MHGVTENSSFLTRAAPEGLPPPEGKSSPVRFSIVVTCHNQRDFIRDAVDSALAQATGSKEIIVVDDASSDGSKEMLAQYGEAIRFVASPRNLGAPDARNLGASVARGEFLVFLDGDDLLTTRALEIYDRLIGARKPALILGLYRGFTGAATDLMKRGGGPQTVTFAEYSGPMLKDRGVGLSASTFVVDRQAFQRVGGWTSQIFHLDLHDIILKLGRSGRTILICSPFTCYYRVHANNSIHNVPPFLRAAHYLLNQERAGGYPGGREHRWERYSWLGGCVFFWIRRAVQAGLYREALSLLAGGWAAIMVSIVRRSVARARGRVPLTTLECG